MDIELELHAGEELGEVLNALRSVPNLQELREKLIPPCWVFLRYGKRYRGDQIWKAGVKTKHNNFPYWIEFGGSSPNEAVDKLLGFFDGSVPDHANIQREPEDFLGGDR